jgi:uncharacterized membrane protein YhaH (DUF805 family)
MNAALLAAQYEHRSQGGSVIPLIVGLAFAVVIIASLWKVFTKAGEPGWACLVPIYNMYILLRIAGRPGWWILLYFIPIVSLVIAIIVSIDIAKAFGKGTGFGIGLAFLGFIFFPILGFGDAQYGGGSAKPAA